MSEFWALVDGEFGVGPGRTLVRDHVLGALSHRTAEQALAAGEDARNVWFALCDDLHVPIERRWGREPAQQGTRPAGNPPGRRPRGAGRNPRG